MSRASSLWVPVVILLTTVIAIACQSGSAVQPTAAPTQAPAKKEAAKEQETPMSKPQEAATAPAAKAPEKTANAPASLEKVKIAQIYVSGALGPFWTARDEGIFKKYGLDVEAVSIQGPQPAVAAMNTGAVDGLLTAPSPPTLGGAAGDMDIVLLMTFSNKLAYYMVARPEIKSPQDLKGKKMAVSRVGDSDYYLARDAAIKLGLKSDDLNYLAVGAMPERVAALVQGMVDATTLSPPTDLMATKQGMVQLADLGELGIPYIGTSLHLRRSLVKEKPQVAEGMVKALTEGMYVFRTSKEAGIRTVRKNMKMDDEGTLVYSWETVAKRLETVPYPSVEGLKAVIKQAAVDNPKLQDLPVEKVIDVSIVKKIEASGFMDSLAKGQR